MRGSVDSRVNRYQELSNMLGQRRFRIPHVALSVVLMLVTVLGVAPSTALADGPVNIVTSISPLADVIKTVGGSRVNVTNLVAVGGDPHAFQPSPQDAVTVSQAQIFFANGLGEEKYLNGLVSSAANPNLVVVTLADGLPTVGNASTNPEFAGNANPHMWIDPNNVIAFVGKIRDTLDQVDPAGKATYDANAAAYVPRLQALDKWVASVSQTVPPQNRNLVVFHDAWAYFCARYGFNNYPLVAPLNDAQPSAQNYAALVNLVKSKQIPAVFGETGFNPKLVQRLAADTGAQFVANLLDDTLGADDSTNTYLKMISYDMQKIVSALGGAAGAPPSF